MATLDDAIEYIRMGNRDEGREVLEEILEEDEENDEGWLWMSAVVDDEEERKICLENVIAINPDNAVAQRALEAIDDGSFDLNDMLSDALDARDSFVEQEEDDEFEDDDELEMPSTMQEKSGPNMRLIILAILGLLIVCGLGSTAGYNIFIAGNGDDKQPTETQPAQTDDSSEADENETEEATSTPGPTSTPTVAPTPTDTPFALPTAPPTEAPSPTATQVVPPTPNN